MQGLDIDTLKGMIKIYHKILIIILSIVGITTYIDIFFMALIPEYLEIIYRSFGLPPIIFNVAIIAVLTIYILGNIFGMLSHKHSLLLLTAFISFDITRNIFIYMGRTIIYTYAFVLIHLLYILVAIGITLHWMGMKVLR
ncbi:TPA: hypothetical protein EYP83_00335 [Candidatus Geothermarchaeota archaeon]|nr:hypothetical protein [Candidatus Geothermarchaeota archaeon]